MLHGWQAERIARLPSPRIQKGLAARSGGGGGETDRREFAERGEGGRRNVRGN